MRCMYTAWLARLRNYETEVPLLRGLHKAMLREWFCSQRRQQEAGLASLWPVVVCLQRLPADGSSRCWEQWLPRDGLCLAGPSYRGRSTQPETQLCCLNQWPDSSLLFKKKINWIFKTIKREKSNLHKFRKHFRVKWRCSSFTIWLPFLKNGRFTKQPSY